MPRFHPGVREHRIVDELHLSEPPEHRLRRLLGHPAPLQRGSELRPGPRRERQQPQADLPRDRLRRLPSARVLGPAVRPAVGEVRPVSWTAWAGAGIPADLTAEPALADATPEPAPPPATRPCARRLPRWPGGHLLVAAAGNDLQSGHARGACGTRAPG